MAFDEEIEPRRADGQVRDFDLIQKRRQDGARERDAARRGVDGHAQAAFDHQIDRTRRPRLRHAGDGIARGPLTRAAREAAEELRQPRQIDEEAGVEQIAEQTGSLRRESIAAEPGGDERVVVRPD